MKKNLNFFILAVLFFLGFALFYFLYHRQRSQAVIYATISLVRPLNTNLNIPYNSVPFWLADSISDKDKDTSLLGGINAEVVSKTSYETQTYGKTAILLLKIAAVRDRSGIYLFKNKPLLVGSLIDLNLTKTQVTGLLTSVSLKPPNFDYEKLRLTVKVRQIDQKSADGLKIGDTIVDNQGREIAKVIDKNVSRVAFSGVRIDANTGQLTDLYEPNQIDMEVTVDIMAKKNNETYFFMEIQKIKANEPVYIPFKGLSLNGQITSVSTE